MLLPETKAVPLEEVEALLEAHWLWGKLLSSKDTIEERGQDIGDARDTTMKHGKAHKAPTLLQSGSVQSHSTEM